MSVALLGSIINSLPVDKMIEGPLKRMVAPQVPTNKLHIDCLLSIYIKEDMAISVKFEYAEEKSKAFANSKGIRMNMMKMPLLATISHPDIKIREGKIDVELEITLAEAPNTMVKNKSAILTWGPFKFLMKNRILQRSEKVYGSDPYQEKYINPNKICFGIVNKLNHSIIYLLSIIKNHVSIVAK